MIYDTEVEFRYKKGRDILINRARVVSVETTAMDMQTHDHKALWSAKQKVFGLKSKAFSENNFWFTKIISQNPLSRSFHFMESYNESLGTWTAIRK